MLKCVARLQGQSVRKTLFHARLQGVVVAVGIVAVVVEALLPAVLGVKGFTQVLRKRAVRARCRIRRGERPCQELAAREVTHHGLIVRIVRGIICDESMCTLIAYVGHRSGDRRRELALDGRIPGVHSRQTIVEGTNLPANVVRLKCSAVSSDALRLVRLESATYDIDTRRVRNRIAIAGCKRATEGR